MLTVYRHGKMQDDFRCPFCGNVGCVLLHSDFVLTESDRQFFSASGEWLEKSYRCKACGKKFLLSSGDVAGLADDLGARERYSPGRRKGYDDHRGEIFVAMNNVVRTNEKGAVTYCPLFSPLGRRRVYSSSAEKQAAYRDRKKNGKEVRKG